MKRFARLQLRALVVCGLTLAIAANRVHAQAIVGAGSSAVPVPRHIVRVSIGGMWDDYDQEFRDGGKQPLFGRVASASFGVGALPQLSAAQQAIRTLSSSPSFALTLGALEASGNYRTVTTPIAIDWALTDKLAVGIVVPYVESRGNALFVLNRTGTGANVGQNPSYGTTTGAATRAANASILRQLVLARTQLTAEIARCAGANALNCDAIRASPGAAATLLQDAQNTLTAISTVYGDSLRGGAPVVPIAGSATQLAINARLAAIRAAFTAFGIAGVSDGLLPAGATIINGPAAIARIVKDSAYALNYAQFGGTRRAGIGDIDLTASYLWFNTLGARPAQWLNAKSFGVRSQITGGWRFGTAGADRSEDALDAPIGEGANALLLRSVTDVLWSAKFWVSGSVRVALPMSDNVSTRRPLPSDTALFFSSTTESAARHLGRRIDIEITPRYVFGRYFAVSTGYTLHRSEADQFTFATADASGATTQSTSALTRHSLLFGMTFSTLSSYIIGRARWPLEAVFQHAQPIAGQGAVTPAVVTERLELRVYTGGFPRR